MTNVPATPAHDELVQRVANATVTLAARVHVESAEPQPDSHWAILVSGLDEPASVNALGQYATALIAQLVGVDLVLSAELLGDGPEFLDALRRNVERAVGADNQIDDGFRQYQRDPWITEAIGHLLFGLANRDPSDCVPGKIHALTLPHTQVREQGLDLVGVFEHDGRVGLSITESKASEQYPAAQLRRAVSLFKALDAGDRDADLLQALNLFRNNLSAEIRASLAEAMWSGERLYAPLLSFRVGLDPSTERQATLGVLAPPSERRRLIVVKLSNYPAFFDGVANAMRAAVGDYGP